MKLVSFNGKGKYSEPEFTWIPTVAPTTLVFFTSDNYGPNYKNTLFLATQIQELYIISN